MFKKVLYKVIELIIIQSVNNYYCMYNLLKDSKSEVILILFMNIDGI